MTDYTPIEDFIAKVDGQVLQTILDTYDTILMESDGDMSTEDWDFCIVLQEEMIRRSDAESATGEFPIL